MKNLAVILCMALAAAACNNQDDGYRITPELEGSAGKWVKLMERVDRQLVTFDSVLVEQGTGAAMTGQVEGVRLMYLTVEDQPGSIQLLVENARYEISGTLGEPVIVTDSRAQSDLNAYHDFMAPLTGKMDDLEAGMSEASREGDQDRLNALREEYSSLYMEQLAKDSSYIAQHPGSFAAVLALRGIFYMYDASALDAALSSLDPKVRQLEAYGYMADKLERMKAVAVGQPYTDFGLETPEGEILSVSDVHKGNVLLIDFWASWCGPCRRANPELVQIYHEYKDRGFEILGVSLDRDRESWLQAIGVDRLDWHHISDLAFWNSKGAELYGVSSIPHTVLISRKGVISAKKLHGAALRSQIEDLL